MIDVAWILVSHGWPFYGVVILVAGYEWVSGRSDKT